jgi:DNA-directed RNA polymerase subunit beta'
MGGEAVIEMLKHVDVHALGETSRGEMRAATSGRSAEARKKRLKVIQS